MIKVPGAIKMTNRQYVAPELLYREGHKVTSLLSLPKIYHLNLIKRKSQTDPNEGISIK